MMTNQTETNKDTTCEIAYFIRGTGKSWKRKTFKNQAAMQKFLDKLFDDSPDAEVQFGN